LDIGFIGKTILADSLVHTISVLSIFTCYATVHIFSAKLMTSLENLEASGNLTEFRRQKSDN